MKIRRMLSLLFSMLLIATVVSGCATPAPTAPATTATSVPATEEPVVTTAPEPTADPFAEHMKFTFSCLDSDFKTENNPWYDMIAKKFNIEIEVIPITWDDWTEKSRVWLTSGDTPDLMWYDGYTYGDYVKFAQQGAMRPLPSLDNYPNLKRVAETKVPGILQKLTIDGKLYGWPHSLNSNPYNEVNTFGYYYRKDWAAKAGYTQNKFTPDEFVKFVKDVIAADPGGLGADKMVGLVALGWWVPAETGMDWISPYYSGYKKIDGKYIWGARLPETLEAIKFCKKMYDEGVLYKDIFTMKSDEGTALFQAGRAVVYADVIQIQQMEVTCGAFAEQNPGIDPYEAIGYLHIVDENGKEHTSQNGEYWCFTLMGAQVSDDKANRAMSLMDWLSSKEGTIATALGIEGKDWTMGADGNPVVQWAKDDKGAYIDPGYLVSGFRHLTECEGDLAQYIPSYSDKTKEAARDYLVDRKANASIIDPQDYDLGFLTTPLKDKFSSGYSEDEKNEIIKLIVSSSNIEEDWNKWLEEMAPKIDPLLEEINNALTK